MVARKRRTFSRTTVVDAPVEQVWDVLRDSQAMYWIVTGTVLALPVPGRPAGVGALTCCWQRSSDGSLRNGVFEVVECEPRRLMVVVERQRPEANSRVEFRLEARGEQTHVRITLAESLFRYEWGVRGAGVNERYLSRLAEGLEVALADEVPGPHDVQTLVLQPKDATGHEVFEIDIDASPERVFHFAEDEEGTLLDLPELESQWTVNHDGHELQVQLFRTPAAGLRCGFQRLLRPEPLRLIVMAFGLEVDQQVLPRPGGCVLRATHRWNPRVVSAELVAASAQRWLAAVKAAAEGDARPAG
jgi:uncharacterized protein YndB with AHSA1/START domain